MRAFILTLMNNQVRRLNASYLQERLHECGFHPELHPALSYTDIRFRDVNVALDAKLTAGEIAAAHSHRTLQQKIIDIGEPAFILEDDAWFKNPPHPDWFVGVEHIMTCGTFPHDDPGCPRVEFTEDGPKRFKTVGMPWGMHGYYLTPEGARVLVDHTDPIRVQADVITHDLSLEGKLKTYVAKDCCIGQHDLITSFIGDR